MIKMDLLCDGCNKRGAWQIGDLPFVQLSGNPKFAISRGITLVDKATNLRDLLKTQGWRRVNSKDYCPQCLRKKQV